MLEMDKSQFDNMIDDLIESCFEIEAGKYYNDRNIEFDDMLEILLKYIKIEK